MEAGLPEEMERLTKMWMTWIEDLKKGGHLIATGERLNPGGKTVQGKAGKTVTDGPYAEAKDFIAGYMLAEAVDIEHAVELSKGCPVLEYEGRVEVRPLLMV